MKRSFLLSLAVGVVVVMVVACDKAAVHVEKDGPITANDDDTIIQNDDLAKDDLLVPEEMPCYVDEDALEELPVDDEYTIRLTRQWGGISYDQGNAVAIDALGNILVVGHTTGDIACIANAGEVDVYLVKFNPNGTREWMSQWGTSSAEFGYGVAVAPNGDILVTGETNGSFDSNLNAGGNDIFLTKWNSNGTKVWTKQWGTDYDDNVSAVAVDRDGNSYITGSTRGSLDGNPHDMIESIFLIKRDRDGGEVWTRQWGDGAKGYSVAIDTAGNIFVTGQASAKIDDNTLAGKDCSGYGRHITEPPPLLSLSRYFSH